MPGTKEIRMKIRSVQNTRKITKAMEMVAASKMRRAQERMRNARPYGEKIRNVAAHISHANPEYRPPFLVERDTVKGIGIIVVSTDKGLCGALNTNLLRLALAQYRELAAFAQFASDLDEATRKQLERGRMVTELMKQPQYQPLQVWEMALTLFAVNNGYYDDVDVKKALAAEKSIRDYLKGKYAALVNNMEDKKDLSADEEKALKAAIEDWKKNGSF